LSIYKSIGLYHSTTAFVVNIALFIGLPALVLVIYGSFLESIKEQDIGFPIKLAIRFAIAWGIFNFILYILVKRIIEVPYVTVNIGDVGSIFNKNNKRGGLMKLVSSYNNGNVFGVCMILLAPVYMIYEKSRIWLSAFFIACILTLSRTVWFGLAVLFAAMVLSREIRLRNGSVWLGVSIVISGIILVMPALGWGVDRLYDSNLGGRVHQLTSITFSWFGEDKIQINEILYAGLLQSFGVLGFLWAFSALAFPVIFGAVTFRRLPQLRRRAFIGCACYLIVAGIDSAFILPPVLAIYLFLNALLYRRGFRPAAEYRRNVAVLESVPYPKHFARS